MDLAYIPDGCTEQGYIAAQKRLHPACRFEYRPFLVEERGRFVAQNAKLQAGARERNAAEQLIKRIASWDLVDKNGDPLERTAANVLKIKPALYERLLAIVTGLDASDEDPEAAADEQATFDQDLGTSERDVIPIGDARQERREKNSSAGSGPAA